MRQGVFPNLQFAIIYISDIQFQTRFALASGTVKSTGSRMTAHKSFSEPGRIGYINGPKCKLIVAN